MSIIYVLQKHVPTLGTLTKIGMTMRSGQDRAAEYGGGGWEVIEEFGVKVKDAYELKEIEGRIHERLASFRCAPATGFGLTEVFTCSSEVASEAARAEIAPRLDDADSVDRLRQRTNRLVERKILQAHASDLARLHMGRYDKVDRAEILLGKSALKEIPWGAPDAEIAEWKIHNAAIDALDRIGAEATTFRQMVKLELDRITARWAEALAQQRAAQAEQERAAKETRVEARRQRVSALIKDEELGRLKRELAEFNSNVARLEASVSRHKVVIWLGPALSVLITVLALESLLKNNDPIYWFWTLGAAALLLACSAMGAVALKRDKEALTNLRKNWDDAHSAD